MKTKSDNLPSANYLVKDYKALLREIDLLLRSIALKPKKEPIHQLRLRIKRIRVIHSLVTKFHREQFEKNTKDIFKKLFKAAGRLREAQLSKELLKT